MYRHFYINAEHKTIRTSSWSSVANGGILQRKMEHADWWNGNYLCAKESVWGFKKNCTSLIPITPRIIKCYDMYHILLLILIWSHYGHNYRLIESSLGERIIEREPTYLIWLLNKLLKKIHSKWKLLIRQLSWGLLWVAYWHL